ncbi:hypothetical protein CI109_105751 [Kwoniella shandongensis]|uniref:Uncharacterized protein n=1 Tax=Kwoniella shandongensis TaxID=1734106 RepID=A0A5M6C5U8_9TREE|nr:uncharacterized protein CI109_003091 [Kwoniella shandongensis]KAA5528559.1 hypothetical protein CI109_003091 [Kwoniella shandongensis]
MSEKSIYRPWAPFRKPSSKNGPGPLYTMLEYTGIGVGNSGATTTKSHKPVKYAGRKKWIFIAGSLLGIMILFMSSGDRHLLHPTCNPYNQHGYLNYAPDEPHKNRWIPFSPNSPCGKTPLLFASLLRTSWSEHGAKGIPDLPGDWWREEVAPDGGEWEDVNWARNKTILVIGDSIQRFNLRYLCEMAGEPLHEIGWDHPWSPPKPATPPPKAEWLRVPEDTGVKKGRRDLKSLLAERGDIELRPESSSVSSSIMEDFESLVGSNTNITHDLGKRAAPHVGDPMGYMGHYCHIPGVDLMIFQLFHFGLDEKNFWTIRPDFVPPYTVEDRVEMLAKPYIANAERPRTAPELTYVASALWDTTRFMREDTEAGTDISEALSPGRLTWYRIRVRQVLVHARQTFPKTHLKWMTHHYPLRALSGWFFQNGDQHQKPQRPQQKLNRLMPLHLAAMSAMEDMEDASPDQKKAMRDIGISKWGELIMGTEDHQRDDLHPNLLPGGYLWADMMMYDLREAVTTKWWAAGRPLGW